MNNQTQSNSRGVPPRKCGLDEKHIGGLVGIIPIVALYCDEPEKARKEALVHLALTHPGFKMAEAASLVIELLLRVLQGEPLKAAIVEEIEKQRTPLVGHPFIKYHNDPENALIVNTNLGGDNAARGSVLGAFLRASHGFEGFPRRRIDGLVDPPPDLLLDQNLV